ncbi:MAG: hypothetical protein GOV00_01930 [Candidatus Altiarchaeota archaeon]|nr:hypothetical protein [Candidatus Altiarchaeota archaeon]
MKITKGLKLSAIGLVLIGALMAFLYLPAMDDSTKSRGEIIERFNEGLAKHTTTFLTGFDGTVPSDKMQLMSVKLFAPDAPPLEVVEADNPEGKFSYLIYMQYLNPQTFEEKYGSGFDCSQYSDSPAVKCEVVRFIHGDVAVDDAFNNLKNTEFSTYRGVYNLLSFCREGEELLSTPATCLSLACSNFYSVEELSAPSTICEKKFYASLRYRCLSDESGFQEVAESEPSSLEELSCYYEALFNYERIGEGI